MKIFKLYRSILLMILAGLALSWNTLSADEQVKIDTDEKAKEILLGHDWDCKWKDPYYSGTTRVVYEEASLKNVTAKGKTSACPNGWGQYKGKIKKGNLTGKNFNYPSPCAGSNTSTSKFYKSADGSYYTKGNYRPSTYDARGESTCVAVAK